MSWPKGNGTCWIIDSARGWLCIIKGNHLNAGNVLTQWILSINISIWYFVREANINEPHSVHHFFMAKSVQDKKLFRKLNLFFQFRAKCKSFLIEIWFLRTEIFVVDEI